MSHGPLGNGKMWIAPGSPLFDAFADAFTDQERERDQRRFRDFSRSWFRWMRFSDPALGVETTKGEA